MGTGRGEGLILKKKYILYVQQLVFTTSWTDSIPADNNNTLILKGERIDAQFPCSYLFFAVNQISDM